MLSQTREHSAFVHGDYLVWFGLVWFGLVWFGLVWFFQANIRRIAAPEYAFVVLGGSVSNAGGSVRRNRPDWRAVPSFCPSLLDPTLARRGVVATDWKAATGPTLFPEPFVPRESRPGVVG